MKRLALALATSAALTTGVAAVAPTPAMAATTRTCEAGSGLTYGWMTVTQTYSGGIYTYQVQRRDDGRRTINSGTSGFREATSDAYALNMYSGTTTTKVAYPNDPHYLKSNKGGNVLRLYWRVTDGGTLNVTVSCAVDMPN